MKKIISSILVASFIASMCAINVMAASTTRSMTIAPSKTADVKAGDDIVVEISLNDNYNITACDYFLNYDPAIFELDTNKTGRNPKNYIDATWYKDITDKDGDWGYYLSTTINEVTSEGQIRFTSNGSDAIEKQYSSENRVIGKYTLKVKAELPVGTSSTTLSLTEAGTLDAGENTPAVATTTPVTITFASTEPTVNEWSFAFTKDTNDYPNGYIWDGKLVAKGDGALTKFDVTFTDEASNTLTKSIKNFATFDWNANLDFSVGLYTDKTEHANVQVAWDIAAKNGDTTVPVNVTNN